MVGAEDRMTLVRFESLAEEYNVKFSPDYFVGESPKGRFVCCPVGMYLLASTDTVGEGVSIADALCTYVYERGLGSARVSHAIAVLLDLSPDYLRGLNAGCQKFKDHTALDPDNEESYADFTMGFSDGLEIRRALLEADTQP